MSLSVSGFQGVNTNGTTVPDSLALGPLAVSSATQDSFYVELNNVLTVTLGNLPPTALFRITLFGSRDYSEPRSTRYDVTGLTTETAVLATSGPSIGISPRPDANRSGSVVVDNIVPTADGKIRIEVRRNGLSFGYLGALRCEILTSVNFPPSVSNLLLTGSSRVGSTLRTACTFVDPDGDPEGQTKFVWERASSPGATGTVISGPAAGASFTLRPEDRGAYVRCGVTPEASSGFLVGQTQYTPWLGPIKAAGVLTTYHIGNSFTRWTSIPQQLANLSVAEPNPALFGMQLTDGQSLQYHWDTGTRTGPGPMLGSRSREEISTASWDVLVLQPFSQEWQSWSMPGFTDYARRFYQLADAAGTQVYLYAYWPWQSQTLSTQTAINAAFEQVRSTISQSGSKPALIIPSGQALKAVIEASGTTGVLAPYNRSSYYLDERHPSALGGYVSALTHYATIYKKSPVGLPATTFSPDASSSVVNIPPAVATKIQQIVWNTVGTYPNSGVVIALEPPPPPPPPPVYVTHSTATAPEVLAFAFGPSSDGVTAPRENLPHAVTAAEPNKLALGYTINPDAETELVTFAPEWSSDLVHWTATQPAGFTQTRNGQKFTLSWNRVDGPQFVRIYVVKPGS